MKGFIFISNSWHLFIYFWIGYIFVVAVGLEFEIKTLVLNVFKNIHTPYRPPCTDIHVNELIS